MDDSMSIPPVMRALSLEAPGKLREVSRPIPAAGKHELLVQTRVTTICTSDLNDIERNPFGITLPRVPGHEGAGIVRGMGEEVRGFGIGNRVAVHPVIPCGNCPSCRRGLAHLCSRMGHLGMDRDGTFAEYFVIPANRARIIPDDLPMEVAPLLEPMAVCLEAVARSRIQPGESLLVVGDGPFGLLMTRLAARRQRARVLLVGQHPFRLGMATEATTLPYRGPVETLEAVTKWSPEHDGVDAAILAVGNSAALQLCLESLRPRGRLVIFSAIHDPPQLDVVRIHMKELEITGACNDENLLDEALACLSDPALSAGEYVTHQFPFSEWSMAFETARNGKHSALKVALNFGGES